MKEAKISKRILAYLLDICLVYLLMTLITNIRFINPTYDKLIEATTEYTELLETYENIEDIDAEKINDVVFKVTKYSISTNIAIIIVLFAYFGLFQKFNNGQTLGKKIMKIKVVGIDDKNVGLGKYLLRILPTYYIYIGSIIPLITTSLIVCFVNSNLFSIINSSVVYAFFALNIITIVMINIRKDKRGIHDLISGTKVVFE